MIDDEQTQVTRDELARLFIDAYHDAQVFDQLYDDGALFPLRNSRRGADAILAEFTLTRKQDPRDTEHVECDCVPADGPPHCHLCGERVGHPVVWSDAHPRGRRGATDE